jgi:hypothetical protein
LKGVQPLSQFLQLGDFLRVRLRALPHAFERRARGIVNARLLDSLIAASQRNFLRLVIEFFECGGLSGFPKQTKTAQEPQFEQVTGKKPSSKTQQIPTFKN